MPKLSMCDRCFFYGHYSYIVCAVHPMGLVSNICIDFRVDLESRFGRGAKRRRHRFINFLGLLEDETTPEPEEEQVVERSFYNGEEITQPQQRWTREQQLELLDIHPMFTGKCPSCGAAFDSDYTTSVPQ